jgi:hypothetical protein
VRTHLRTHNAPGNKTIGSWTTSAHIEVVAATSTSSESRLSAAGRFGRCVLVGFCLFRGPEGAIEGSDLIEAPGPTSCSILQIWRHRHSSDQVLTDVRLCWTAIEAVEGSQRLYVILDRDRLSLCAAVDVFRSLLCIGEGISPRSAKRRTAERTRKGRCDRCDVNDIVARHSEEGFSIGEKRWFG